MKTALTTMIAIGALLGGTQQAHAQVQYCEQWTPWAAAMPISVRLHEDIHNDICNGSATCTTFSDVERTVRATLSEFYQGGSSPIRFEYDGPTSAGRGDFLGAGTLHIYGRANCDTDRLGRANVNDPTTQGIIELCGTKNEAPKGAPPLQVQIPWRTMGFQHALLHEIGHVVGIMHVDDEDCMGEGNGPMSIMRKSFPHGDSAGHFFKYDVDWLQLKHGYRTNVGRAVYSDDILSWTTSSWTAPFNAQYSLGRFAATNSLSGESIFVSYGDDLFRTIRVSKYGPSNWAEQSTVFLGVSNYHSGIASASDTDVVVAWLGSYDDDTGEQTLYRSYSADAGVTWTAPASVGFANTSTSGVAATYDPRQGEYLYFWRDEDATTADNHQLKFLHEVGSTVRPLVWAGTSDPVRAADTPTVACGNLGGSTNCLFAWVDADDWQRAILWFQASFDVNGVLINKSSVYTHSYIAMGSPSVAVRGSTTYPWVIHVNQGGTTTFTWRKLESFLFDFQNEQSYSFSPTVTLPAAGSRTRFSGPRAYGFVLDP